MTRIRHTLLLSAALLTVCSPAGVQAPTSAPTKSPAAPPPAPEPTQMDRIEQKLDEVLRRLDHGQNRPSEPPGAASRTEGLPTPTPKASTPPAPSQDGYKPGALVVVRAAPRDPNALSTIPADGVGGFVYAGGPIPLSEIGTRGVRFTGPVGAEIQGWFRAKEAGRYQLAVDIAAHLGPSFLAPTCFLQAWLEDRSLDQRAALVSPSAPGTRDGVATLVLGAELQPGLYRLRLWTVCAQPQGSNVAVELLMKAPSELNLRPVTGADMLHREDRG